MKKLKSIIYLFLMSLMIISCTSNNDSLKEKNQQKKMWLSSLITDNPQEGFELAIKLSRMGVKSTQPNIEVLKKLRSDYAEDAFGLTAASQVIAINFQTIASANNYWK